MVEVEKGMFSCDTCPLCIDFERRMRYAEDNGIEVQYDHCGCEKVEGQFFCSGYCEDAFQPPKRNKRKGKRMSGREFRRIMRYHKNKRLTEIAKHGRVSLSLYPAYGYNNETEEYEDLGYLKHSSRSNRRCFLKRRSNKKVRATYMGMRGSQYRKCFDYWWELD